MASKRKYKSKKYKSNKKKTAYRTKRRRTGSKRRRTATYRATEKFTMPMPVSASSYFPRNSQPVGRWECGCSSMRDL